MLFQCYKCFHLVLKDPFSAKFSKAPFREEEKNPDMRKMTSDSDDSFQALGPKHLTTVDWSNLDHQRSIMSCMVQGAYMVEKDRSEKRNHWLAPDWWENFHYELHDKLIDDHDDSIYAIVLRFKEHPQHSNPIYSPEIAPRIVIAFRGTMLDIMHGIQDCILDLYVCIGGLDKRSRVQNAIEKVQMLVDEVGPSNVWLTGHSLGAAMATVIGKYMLKEKDTKLNTFLFNPPFGKIPLDIIPLISDKVKKKMHGINTCLKAAKALVSEGSREKSHDINDVAKLSSWIPNIFVHSNDPICMDYINHFKRIKDLVNCRDSLLTKLFASTSTREKLSDVASEGVELSHILPSASLWINKQAMDPKKHRNPVDDLFEPHKIYHWWQPDLQLEASECHYKHEIKTIGWYDEIKAYSKSEVKKLGWYPNSDQTGISEIGEQGKGSEDYQQSLFLQDDKLKIIMQEVLKQSWK
ncbi:hypothetical protein LUZ60_000432 [Juncus effusus]|nr:hypothetical protein LUZ60_000432 [Juncus effusus]